MEYGRWLKTWSCCFSYHPVVRRSGTHRQLSASAQSQALRLDRRAVTPTGCPAPLQPPGYQAGARPHGQQWAYVLSCASGTAPDDAGFGDRQVQTKHTAGLLRSPCPPCLRATCARVLRAAFCVCRCSGTFYILVQDGPYSRDRLTEPGVTTHVRLTSDGTKAGMSADLFANVTCCHLCVSCSASPEALRELPQLGSKPQHLPGNRAVKQKDLITAALRGVIGSLTK